MPTLNEQYNTAVQYSITAGHLEGQTASATTATGSATGSAASASSTTKPNAAGRVAGVDGGMRLSVALAAMGGVFLGFTLWL